MPHNLSTLSRFAEKHPDAFTEASLRWLRFRQDSNGFASAFVTVGRRVLIDEDAFFEVIAQQNGRKTEAGVTADVTSGPVMDLAEVSLEARSERAKRLEASKP